jgi:hypothetical protein
MNSDLHMHLAGLMIQDEIRRGADARRATEAKKAARADAKTAREPRRHRVTLRRFRPSLRHGH